METYRDKKQKSQNGSCTVEMAVILSVCLTIFFGLLYLGFYRYDQAVCKSACYEMAYIIVRDRAENDQVRQVKTQLRESTVALKNLQVQTDVSKDKVQITATGKLEVPLLPVTFSVHAEQMLQMANPVKTIRSIRWGKQLIGK